MFSTTGDEGLARLDDGALDVLGEADRLAEVAGAGQVGTAYLLLALLEALEVPGRVGEGSYDQRHKAGHIHKIFVRAGVTRSNVRDVVFPWEPHRPELDLPPWGYVDTPRRRLEAKNGRTWSRHLRRIVNEARREAKTAGRMCASPFFLLLAVTAPHDGTTAAEILRGMVVDPVADPRWLHESIARRVLETPTARLDRRLRHIELELDRIDHEVERLGDGGGRKGA